MEGNYIIIYAGKLNSDVSLEHAVEQVSLAFKIPKEKNKGSSLELSVMVILL